MGIAKEIFGLERLSLTNTENTWTDGYQEGFHRAVDTIDAFELSEEAMLKIINKASREWHEDYRDRDVFSHSAMIAKAIKANANKIFVRRG